MQEFEEIQEAYDVEIAEVIRWIERKRMHWGENFERNMMAE
jgi:hypothetical protein